MDHQEYSKKSQSQEHEESSKASTTPINTAQQSDGQTGILGAVRSYIPGMSGGQNSADAYGGQQGNTNAGILSYIPGFGGNTSANTEGVNTSASQPGGVDSSSGNVTQPAGEGTGYGSGEGTGYGSGTTYGSDNTAGQYNGGGAGQSSLDNQGIQPESGYRDSARGDSFSFDHGSRGGAPDTNNFQQTGTGYGTGAENPAGYDSSYQGSGVGEKYSTGGDLGDNTANLGSNTLGSDTGAYQQNDVPSSGLDSYQGTGNYGGQNTGNYGGQSTGSYGGQNTGNYGGQNAGSYGGQDTGNFGGQQQTQDDGVRGAPIEGDGVKGYAVSAPVGSGDTANINTSGDPSGQVSGAHMQYLPDDTDTRDHTGRGTVGHTSGEGDSSFANVKRAIPNGTEHVVTKSSQSHIEHTSTTQL